MEDLAAQERDRVVDWEDDPRNLGRLSPREVMLTAYGEEAVRAIERQNAADQQASTDATVDLIGYVPFG